MFTWIKKLLGVAPAAPLVLENPVVEETPKAAPKPKKATTQKPKTTTKKAAPKKAAVDLDTLKKPELLAHAKELGIKANASMSKGAILDAIKSA